MTIIKTTNYNQFKFLESNRPIDHLQKMIKSLKEKNMMEDFPIKVFEKNGFLWVIDGQHRIKAAQFLNIPVYYEETKNLDESDIARCQQGKQWNLENFLHFFDEKNESYKFVKEMAEKTNSVFGLSFIIKVCSPEENHPAESFRNGTYEIKKNKSRFEKNLLNMIDILKTVTALIPTCKIRNGIINIHHNFLIALWRLVNSVDYDHAKMIHKCGINYDYFKEAIRLKKDTDILKELKTNVYTRKDSRSKSMRKIYNQKRNISEKIYEDEDREDVA